MLFRGHSYDRGDTARWADKLESHERREQLQPADVKPDSPLMLIVMVYFNQTTLS